MTDTERKLRDHGIPAKVESSDEDDLESSPLPSPTTARARMGGSSPAGLHETAPTGPLNQPDGKDRSSVPGYNLEIDDLDSFAYM